MKTRSLWLALLVVFGGSAFGADSDRYARFMNMRANTLKSVYEQFTVVEERKDETLRLVLRKSIKGEEFGKQGRIYVFTEAGHAAHPALMIIQLQEKDGDLLVKREGFAGGDQKAFDDWVRTSVSQDRADAASILGQPVDAGRSPTPPASDPGAEERVAKSTRDYFAARDADKARAAYEYFDQPTPVTFEGLSANVSMFNSKAGKVKERHLKRYTWYTDPGGMPKGLYVAVDYESTFENIDIHCGYVIWRQKSDGSFKLIREEEGHIDRASATRLTPEKIEELKRTQLKCKT